MFHKKKDLIFEYGIFDFQDFWEWLKKLRLPATIPYYDASPVVKKAEGDAAL